MTTKHDDNPDGTAPPDDVQRRLDYLRTHRDEIPGRLISLTARCGMMYITKQLARFDIGAGQAFIMAELFIKDGVSQDEVRCLLKMDKGTITRSLQRLEESGFITRKHDVTDRRVVRVFVAEKARAIEGDFFRVLYGWNQGILKGVSEEEQQVALAVLRRMAENAEVMARACE